MPGYVDQSIYPLHDDLAKAKALAESQGVTPATPVPVVLYTSNGGAAPYRAQIIQTELAQIGLNVTIVEMPRNAQIERTATLGEPFDITTEGWIADYNATRRARSMERPSRTLCVQAGSGASAMMEAPPASRAMCVHRRGLRCGSG